MNFYKIRITKLANGYRYTATIKDESENLISAEIEVSEDVAKIIKALQRQFNREERKAERIVERLNMLPIESTPFRLFEKSAEEIFLEQEEAAQIEAALFRIPAKHVRRFLMNCIDGLTAEQIAAKEGVSPRAVEYSIQVVRKKFKSFFEN